MLYYHTTTTGWEVRTTTVDYNHETKRMVIVDYFAKVAEQEECEDYHWVADGDAEIVSDDLGYELDDAFDELPEPDALLP